MNNTFDLTHQMELSFNNQSATEIPQRKTSHRAKAKWWFQQMRTVVDRTFDWTPAPIRAEQTYMKLSRVKV